MGIGSRPAVGVALGYSLLGARTLPVSGYLPYDVAVGRFRCLLVVVLVVSACGESSSLATGSEGSGDGPAVAATSLVRPAGVGSHFYLDCEGDQVVRGAGIDVSGASEQEVVVAALERWIVEGASLYEWPSGGFYFAVVDGRAVAVTEPEIEGDGG